MGNDHQVAKTPTVAPPAKAPSGPQAFNPDNERGNQAFQDGMALKARELKIAIDDEDLPTILSSLAGPLHVSVPAAWAEDPDNTETVEQYIQKKLHGRAEREALVYLEHGEQDLRMEVDATTRDIYGTDVEKLWTLLDNAGPIKLLELAQFDDLKAVLQGELSLYEETRAMETLQPYWDIIEEHGNDAAAQLEAAVQLELKSIPLADAAGTLLTRLYAREGWVNDDEDGMLEDVRTWSAQRGPTKIDDPELKDLLSYLYGELSSRQYEEAKNIITTGNQRALQDKIDEAGADTSLFGLVGDVDEESIYSDLASATPEERAALKKEDVNKYLDGEEAIFFNEELRADALRESSKPVTMKLNDVLAACEGLMWASDAQIFDAINLLSTDEIISLQQSDKMRSIVEEGLTGEAAILRFHGIIGYAPAVGKNPAVALTSEELTASPQRLIGRIQAAAGHLAPDIDSMVAAVVDFSQSENAPALEPGQIATIRKAVVPKRRRTRVDSNGEEEVYYVESEFDLALFDYMQNVFDGSRKATSVDRMAWATKLVLGTEDTAKDNIIDGLSDTDLLENWTNLHDFKKLAADSSPEDVDALQAFKVDIHPTIIEWLKGDLSNPAKDIAKLREQLMNALGSTEGAAFAKETFGYSADPVELMQLMKKSSDEIYEEDRGSGWLNTPSTFLMDQFSARGAELDASHREYSGEVEVTSLVSSDEERAAGVERAEAKRQEFMSAAQAYEAARDTAANIASTVAAAVGAIAMSIATMGWGSPAAAALMTAMVSAGAGEVVELMVQGKAFDPEQAAMDLSVAFVTTVMTLPLAPAATALGKGLGSTAVIKSLDEAVGTALPMLDDVGSTLAAFGAKAVVEAYPNQYISDVMQTEGLLRKGMSGAAGSLKQAAISSFTELIGDVSANKLVANEKAIQLLKDSGKWDAATKTSVQRGLVSATAAAAACKLNDGTALSPEDVVALLGKFGEIGVGGALERPAMEADANKWLTFFNESTEREISALPGISGAMAERIVAGRQGRIYQNVGELLTVEGFERELLSPSADRVVDLIQDSQKSGTEDSGME